MDWPTSQSPSDSGTESTQERVECVKARLQEEGREARNLIAYNVPISNKKQQSSGATFTSDRSNKAGKDILCKDAKKTSTNDNTFKKDKRQRSASAGRDPQASLRARHWGFLFRNLEQAVHEIYQTCEDDESTIECKEAILMLERYTNDFWKLIEWFKIKWEYEHTPPPQRPTSLTWEIRTSSPGKVIRTYKKKPLQDTRRVLSFDSSNITDAQTFNLRETKHDNVGTHGPNSPSIIIHSTDNLSERKSPLKINCDIGLDYRIVSKPKLSDDRIEEENTISTEIESHIATEQSSPEDSLTLRLASKELSSSNVNLRPALTKDSVHKGTKTKEETCEAKVTKEISKVNSSIVCIKEKESLFSVMPSNKQCSSSKDKKDITCNEITCELNKFEVQTTESNKEKIKFSKLETKKIADVQQVKNNVVKPGPLVNMNKASEVRKAYNQNRTPQRPLSGNAWISATNQVETKENGVKNQLSPRPIGLTRSATTLEGSVWNSTFNTNRKELVSEKSFCMGVDGEKYTSSSSLASSTNTSSSVQSWADKVKGITSEEKQDPILSSSLKDEDEGWEIVKRGRRGHSGSSASLNSQTPPSSTEATLWKAHATRHKQKDDARVHYINKRFQLPSSAVSMPSLSFLRERSEKGPDAISKNVSQAFERKRSFRNSMSSKREAVVARKSKDKNMGVVEQLQKNTGEVRKLKDEECVSSPDKTLKVPENNKSLLTTSVSDNKSSNVDKCRKDATNICKRNASILITLKSDIDVKTNSKHLTSNVAVKDQFQHLPSEDSVTKVVAQPAKLLPENISEENRISLEGSMASSILLSNCNSVKGSTSPSLSKSPVNNDDNDESEMEEEQMKTNAAALESAEMEEKRLQKEIEETKRETIEACEGIQEEDETGEKQDKTDTDVMGELTSSSYSSPSMSWAEEIDFAECVEAARQPGRVLHMHEKLSSPSRKLPISEKYRRHKEKLAKAQELRGKLIQAKTEKLKDLFRKIYEVNLDKERLLMEKRDLFECKMERAEEKRKSHLQEIINKAHDEENKAREIAFINGLEAQNKLHDIMQQHQSHESRLADRAEERFRKLEEKAAKEAAAQERRKALEAGRQEYGGAFEGFQVTSKGPTGGICSRSGFNYGLDDFDIHEKCVIHRNCISRSLSYAARMAELCERRKRHCERIDRQQQERREELLEQAREKARDREERLSALQQAQLAKESELVKKIQQKQEETARRHEENIEQIRQKALESSIMKFSRGCDDAPKLLRYETKKLCTLCNSLIASEVYLLSHLRGKHHQEALKELHKSDVTIEESQTYNIKFIVDAPSNIDDPQITRDKERQKALKKRCKKIRNRMTSRIKEYIKTYQPPSGKDTPFKMRMSKSLAHIGKLLSSQGLGPWPTSDVTSLDRHLLELLRLLENTNSNDQTAFAALNGFRRLFPILNLINANEEEELPSVVPSKSLTFCARVFLTACRQSKSNCLFLLLSNMIGDMVDFIIRRFNLISSEMSGNLNDNSLNTQMTLPSDSTTAALLELIAEVLSVLSESKVSEKYEKLANIDQPLQDVVSYCVSMGVADKISWYFSHIQQPVDNDPPSSQIILSAMSFISALAGTISGKFIFFIICSASVRLFAKEYVSCYQSVTSVLFRSRRNQVVLHQCSKFNVDKRRMSNSCDPTQLIGTFHVTDACGVVSLLYGLLLHQGSRSASPPPDDFLSPSTVAISGGATTLLRNLAELDLNMFQTVLGSEGISLEFRHIASFLLWYCSLWTSEEILHNVISLVGFFTVNNKENQMVIQSGESPSVLQKLCSLPWQYFSEPRLTGVLFPTLLACCHHNDDNMNILQQEMSFQVLEDFLKNNEAESQPLMQIIRKTKLKSAE